MKKISAILIISTMILPSSVFAVGSGGFENASFSARSIAQSNAVTAQADEAAAVSYNPAGITQLKGLQTQTSQDFIGARTWYVGSDHNTTHSGGTMSYVPTGYVTLNLGRLLNDRLVLGIGSDSPFGLSNKYDSAHQVAHYVGFRNGIKMFTIKPVVAYKFNDKYSVGIGPVFYKLFDFNAMLAYANQLVTAGAADGLLRVNLSGKTWGWQMGFLAKPHKKHQLGFYFRSPALLRLRGSARVEGGAPAGADTFRTGGYAKMHLPLNMTWAYAYKHNDKLTLEADFGYTRWQVYERLFITSDPVSAGHDSILSALGKVEKDYNDGFSLHFGTNYIVNPKWTLMGGMLFYWAVIPKDHWNVSIADSNRLGWTFGTGYNFTDWLGLEVAYFSALNLRRKIDNSSLDALGHTMDGRYTSYIYGLFITLTYKWESLFQEKKSSAPQQKETPQVYIAPPAAPLARSEAINDTIAQLNIPKKPAARAPRKKAAVEK